MFNQKYLWGALEGSVHHTGERVLSNTGISLAFMEFIIYINICCNSLGPIRRQLSYSRLNKESLSIIIYTKILSISAMKYKETLHGTLGLRESTQGRTNLEEVQTSLEKVWFSHQRADRFPGLARPELVWSYWANNRQLSGVQGGEQVMSNW